jgi:hypothetical protein
MRSITTVVTKASSRDLTTLATAKEELGITGSSYDARLKRWIREESASVERFCGRRLVNETLQQTFTGNEVGFRTDVVLALYPVSEVISVTWNNEVLTPDQWQLDGEAGLLRRYSQVDDCWVPWFGGNPDVYWYMGYPYPNTIIVQYTGGYTLGQDLPPDLEAAVLIQLGHRKATTGSRDQTIRTETVVNVMSTTYFDPAAGENAAIVPAAAARLEPYREQRI